MLYLHETHAVIGEHETTFEHHVRDGYVAAVATDPEARLLWYLDSTHGAGEGYKVVTVTGFATPAAWERHVERLLDGDLAEWMRRADELRYSLVGMLLVDASGADAPVLADVPTDGREHERALLRQDVVRAVPGADLGVAARSRAAQVTPGADDLLRFERAWVPALTGTEEGQVVLLHRILDAPRWIGSWHDDVAEWSGGLGPLTGEAGREVRVLRTSSWSPLD